MNSESESSEDDYHDCEDNEQATESESKEETDHETESETDSEAKLDSNEHSANSND